MLANFNLQRELTKEIVCCKIDNGYNEPHFHSHIEIYLINSGELDVFIGDKRKILRKGEISVAFSYDTHGFHNSSGADGMLLIIPPEYFSEFVPIFQGKHVQTPFINDPDTYKTVRGSMEKLKTVTNEISKRGYVYVILGAILDRIPMEKYTEPQVPSFPADMLIYINRHFKEELTLELLASEFGYNRSYFSRHFKESFGISFGKYLAMIRLREAILLLKDGKMNVTECALESGFGSVRSFYRAFKDEFGCTPHEYFCAGE